MIKERKRSEQQQVTGKVSDENGQPIPGVTVLIKGTTNGTATDFDGSYSITVPNPENVLVFSALGFATQEITVGNQSVINVTIKEEVSELGEVVLNAGYYKTSKRTSTGNISKITTREIEKQPVSNPMQTLQGRVSGLYIQQENGLPGGNFDVVIRGKNSILNGNNPLYVIDGVPFNSSSLSSDTTSGGTYPGGSGVNPLNIINTNDIESIEVLKDADATAIYGSRGANGVILITTKKGKVGKTKIDLNIYSGISKVGHKVKLLNTQEYIEMRNEALINDSRTNWESWEYDMNGAWDQNQYTDWQKELIGGTANVTNTQISFSGGNSNTQFLLSGGQYEETTVFQGDYKYNKKSAHMSFNHLSLDQKFNVTASANYLVDKNNLLATDLTRTALTLSPNAPNLYNDDGELNWENGTWNNPLARNEYRYKAKNNNLIANAQIGYKIFSGFEIKMNLGFNDSRFGDRNVFPATLVSDPSRNVTSERSRVQINTHRLQSWIFEPQISYSSKLGDGQLNFLIGTSFQAQESEKIVQIGRGFSSDALVENIAAATNEAIDSYDFRKYKYDAIYGRINYLWKEKYILNLTGRRDGSSRFGPGKKFANFGAIGAAWIFSEENSIKKNLPFLSYGKLRISYGTSGNDQIDDYAYLDNYNSVGVYQDINGLSPTSLYNPNYAWEVNKKLEVGLEQAYINNRIVFSASYFRNRSSNQLLDYTLAMTTGFTGIRRNLPATVQNTGLELEFQTLNIKKNGFTWVTSANLTIPRNKLVDFPDIENSTYRNQYVVGEPLSILKRYKLLGVNSETGIYEFEDMDGDGIITANDRLLVKNVGQKMFGGINNSISINRFQIDFLFQFVKQTGLSYFNNLGLFPGIQGNLPRYLLDRWQNPGDNSSIQQFTTGYNSDSSLSNLRYPSSDAAIVDASFIRLKNVELSYQIPEKPLKGIKSRIYLQGQNLLTFTNYIGLDPENFGSAVLPPLTTLVLGVQITF
ncbi:SusC/RagA family TonB-linked outer membrane protein [Flagellimonas alvinocaridis]|uniref:SusC/RagA family TonB-linked outer membrane protein n=1 Tax=Flagellimonas alvinocaridis TaxID=2530200 RepID=UPI0013761AFB|nr:SusC/RagA family TonB-linked outer membrane protein [Allomuricauda alvinocaridis]